MQIPFLGGSAEDRFLGLNAQKSINCFPVIDNKEAKGQLALRGTPGLKFFTAMLAYGDGSDGIVTISTDTTLTRDMQYATLTVDSGKVLDTAGYIVVCSGTLTNNSIITDAQSGGAGGDGGTLLEVGRDGAESLVPGAGAGGKGGDSGSADGTSTGGKGGKGGGCVRIYAKTLTNNGVIHADGFDAPDDAVGTGAGGNGGNGGLVSLTYDARTIGTVRANAGAHRGA